MKGFAFWGGVGVKRRKRKAQKRMERERREELERGE